MSVRAVVWGENVHDRENHLVRRIYPDGMHSYIADALNIDPTISATTATLEQLDHGLSEERLATPMCSFGATLHLPYLGKEGSDMTCSFTPFGGGSRVVSLWDMLRFHANKFVEVLNLLNTVETLLDDPKNLLSDSAMLSYFGDEVQRLKEQLLGLNLWVSAKEAERIRFGLTSSNRDKPDAWALYIKSHIEKLRNE